jgi:hypothetical protein
MDTQDNTKPVEWRVNNGFIFNSDCVGLVDVINNILKEHRVFTCRFWWCPMNQCLLRLMIYQDQSRLEPTLEGALRIRDNIYQIYEAVQKIIDQDKQQAMLTGLSAIFPCVIEDTTNGRYTITVSVNSNKEGLAKGERPRIWITILDRESVVTETYAY